MTKPSPHVTSMMLKRPILQREQPRGEHEQEHRAGGDREAGEELTVGEVAHAQAARVGSIPDRPSGAAFTARIWSTPMRPSSNATMPPTM